MIFGEQGTEYGVRSTYTLEKGLKSLSPPLYSACFCHPREEKTPRMPPIRTSRNRKPPPDGFEDIEDTLLEFSNKMKDAESMPHDGKKKHEVLWPIFQISHQREWATVDSALLLNEDYVILIAGFFLQDRDISMIYITKKAPYRNSCMSGFLRIIMPMRI